MPDMDLSQVHSGFPTQTQHGNFNTLQIHVKDEFNGNDFLEGTENGTYRPRPQLPKPFVLMRSLQHLMNGLNNGTIDVDPEYQREVVWTAERMTGLVDSLMENFYIPPIILNKKPEVVQNGGPPTASFICVDGKQRLSSVLAFIKGIIPCHDHRGEKWWFGDQSISRRKNILSEAMQKQFLEKELVSFEFTNLSSEQEEDLFARVQMGVQLSVAEKMRAQSGPWQELARLFVDDFPSIYSLMKERARAKDFQLTLSCFSQIVEVMHPTAANGVPILKTNHSHLPKLLSNKGAVDDGLKSHLANVWNTFKDLINEDSNTFTNENKTLTGVQTFAPVEMVAVTVLISTYSETRNNQLLIGDIQALRNALRVHFTDLRLNIATWKFVWDFIHDLEAIRGAVDGSTVNPDQRSMPTPGSSPAVPSALGVPAEPTQKRRRPVAKNVPWAVQPSQQPATTKSEEVPPAPPSRVRPAKRRRVDPDLADGEVSGTLTDAEFSGTSGNQSAGSAHTVSSKATQAKSQAERMNDSVSTPPMVPWPAPANQTLVWRNPYEPNARQSQQKGAVITPTEARQKRVSELNSYRAPIAPLGSSRPSAPTAPTSSSTSPISTARRGSTISPFPMWPEPSPTTPVALQSQSKATKTPNFRVSTTPQARKSNNTSPNTRTALGAFTPAHADEQWEGVTKSVSPEQRPLPSLTVQPPIFGLTSRSSAKAPLSGPASTAPPTRTASRTAPKVGPSQPLPTQKARRTPSTKPKPAHPTLPQYDGAIDLTDDGAIDLTSDTEQERQSLLTSFKPRSAAGAQGKDTVNRETSKTQALGKQTVDVDVDVENQDTNPTSRERKFKRRG
ncbi:hypothetical protein P153DRAFT_430331 [Dothidotthia symphoricarpi CBS 119687]|uniref:GmrSD restriction endonucleases N-terminal domain-containing protein n=1 Tax=Dothidotthia symphoricarpi CBS 119687 TaxID=1392245 RepID=A0A6A6AH04_9PLEO|nr:uncharacterized protein P153DRAFT_430331 [Dothidotthia symphoricarpi CBS 119687]KAF2131080.1 hypothetical protein P153DRAFT_430331 [Dothidotthia symphoricarpi CBS 119687]